MANTNKQKRDKYFYISFLNVLSTVSVVVLHSNGAFWDYRNDINWILNNMVECVFYFAVPIFFMLVGVNLLDYTDKYDTKTFFKKRVTKTVVPFLIWSIFAMLLKILQSPRYFIQNEIAFDKIFNGIFNTEYMFIYWFFIPLFCIYLSVPLLAHIEKKNKNRIFTYIAATAFVVNIFIPFSVKFINIFFGTQIIWIFEIPVLGGYAFYGILGYLLHNNDLSRKIRIIIYTASVLGLLIHFFTTYYLSFKIGRVDDTLKGYNQLPGVLYSSGIFLLVKQLSSKIKSDKFKNIIFRFQKYTFPIYLMHWFIYIYLSRILETINIHRDSQIFVILITLISVPVCIGITFVLRKIPVVRNIVP